MIFLASQIKHTTTFSYLRVVITINFLHAHNKFMCNFAKAQPILQNIESYNKLRFRQSVGYSEMLL